MAKKTQDKSQLLDLFLHVAHELGAHSDREVAQLAGVSVDNIANWRDGTVHELKAQTLKAIKDNLTTRVRTLKEQVRAIDSTIELGLIPIDIEEASGPTALQRQFVDRMIYDYLGHRFLYFEPQGALAWENLIKAGYEQDRWLLAVRDCIRAWLDPGRDASGAAKGPIAHAVGLDRKGTTRGLDVISLGPGEGGKEVVILKELLAAEAAAGVSLSFLTLALVDVSIPLLVAATKSAKLVMSGAAAGSATPKAVLSFCADFEEGDLSFVRRLPTATPEGESGRRLVLLLGNVFGNVRDEETFLRQKLTPLIRPGDLVWIDVGLRPDRIEKDPLYPMTIPDKEASAAFTNRRLLLEGPYRRWEAAIGRPPSELETRVWIREGDETAHVPGSVNFCHDLHIKNERRVCTMLYSRRYQVEGLSRWLEANGFRVLRVQTVEDSRQRVLHVLAERV